MRTTTESLSSVSAVNQYETGVVIPVCGRPAMLTEAIDSVLNGTMTPAALVVVVDSLGEIALADANAAERCFDGHRRALKGTTLSIIAGNGRGPGAARNAGAGRITQPWLAFLDSDDLWVPEKLERQTAYMSKRPHLNASHCAETWWKNDRIVRQPRRLHRPLGRFLGDAFSHCLVSSSSFMIRRVTFESLGGFDGDFFVAEDFEFWLRYLSQHPIGMVQDPLVVKRSGAWPQLSARHSLDIERIRAILKAVRAGDLATALRERARGALAKKFAIVRRGEAKYGYNAQVEELAVQARLLFDDLDLA